MPVNAPVDIIYVIGAVSARQIAALGKLRTDLRIDIWFEY